MYCDLHTHSIYSDGTCTPAQIITQAKALGLVVALTDHNTVAGLPPFLAEAERQGVTAVPGIEFSTLCRDRELHLLGLFIAPEHYTVLETVMEEYHTRKEASNRDLVQRLNAAGYAIDYAEIRRNNPGGNLNRAHIAVALMQRGYVSSVQEAFATVLDETHGYYIPCKRFAITDAIALLRSIGAVPILAHPLQELTEAELRQILPELIDAGLLGLETHHSSYDTESIALALSIAEEYRLLPSGGSDFHGQAKPDIRLGVGRGNLRIPLSFYDHLLSRSKE